MSPTRLRYAVAPGEANGLPIVFREDGYINMTKAIKGFPRKHLDDFWRNESTAEYIAALDLFLTPDDSRELIQAKKGRYGGTFCHPKLAVFFARWLDVRFAVWCDLMIGFARSYCVATTSFRATFRHLWWSPPRRPLRSLP